MNKNRRYGSTNSRVFHRILWLVIIEAVMELYFPINRLARGGVELSLPIDRHIPLIPVFIVPYLFGNLLFVALPIYAAIRIKPVEFESYAISLLIAAVISYVVFVTIPTYVIRPEIVNQDFFSRAVAALYQTDKAYNAAPSGHTFYTILAFLYLSRWYPKYMLIWGIIALAILTSTLLTRQHNILDLVSGLALAVLSFTIITLIRKKWNLNFAS